MTKKAVIVGISKYVQPIPNLESPDREIQEWRNLLVDTYDFPIENIRLLANERAVLEEVEIRFDWLFRGGEKDDQLVFIFCGHGMKLRKRDETTEELLDNKEEVILTYPRPGETVEKFAFYDDDLMARLARSNLPAGTNVTFILDCCFGGGFNSRDLPPRRRLMGVPQPVDLQHRSFRHRAPGWDERRWAGRTIPLFLNAAGELNEAVELELGGATRSLFSYHAINELRRNPGQTYDNLLDAIRGPMLDHHSQHPNIRGNQSRRSNTFLL